MQRPEIPFSFLATQICRNCQMPVSCAPVYVINDLSILCGRCKKLATDHYRNHAYEALGSVFLYPCQNWRNHCPMKLRWNDSLEHEQECNYIGCCSFIFSHPGAFFKGKRDIPRDEMRLVIIPEELLDYIKCTLCEGYLNCAPVYIEANGQNICHRCVNANGNPPNCRRNRAYESFSKMFVFPCIYMNRGCPERMPFGMSLWEHESECDFGIKYKKKISPVTQQYSSIEQSRDVKQKERGLIKTQTGVIWATLTPNTDATKQFLNSLTKKQARNIRRVDDVGKDMERRNSDTESVSTSDSFSFKNSASYSGNSTPDPLEPSRKPLSYIPPDGRSAPYGSRPDSRESGYQNGYHDDLESNSDSTRPSLRPKDSYRDFPVAGNFPVMTPRHLNEGFDSTGQRFSQRESFRGNSLLISELKVKQDFIKRTHSVKGEQDVKNPYKTNNNNNLEEIRESNQYLR